MPRTQEFDTIHIHTKRLPYKEWHNSLPEDLKHSNGYYLEEAYNTLPIDELEEWRLSNGNIHLRSVAPADGQGRQVFLKDAAHATVNEEFKWYYGDTDAAEDYRNNYYPHMREDGRYEYVPRRVTPKLFDEQKIAPQGNIPRNPRWTQ